MEMDAFQQQVLSIVRPLEDLLNEAREAIAQIENEMIDHLGGLSQSAVESLGIAKRVMFELERRLSKIGAVLGAGGKENYDRVCELLEADLQFSSSPMETLIDAGAIDPIPPDRWAATLVGLLDQIEADAKRSRKKTSPF